MNHLEDTSDSDDEFTDPEDELVGDDEDLSEENEDAEEGEEFDEINMQGPRDENDEINVVDNQPREIATKTIFKGIDSTGMRVPLRSAENIEVIDHFIVSAKQAVRHHDTYEHMLDDFKGVTKSF